MYHPPGQQEQPRLPQIQSQQQLPGQHNYPALNSPLRFTIPAQPNYLYLPQQLQQLQHVPSAQLQQVQPSAQFQQVPPSSQLQQAPPSAQSYIQGPVQLPIGLQLPSVPSLSSISPQGSGDTQSQNVTSGITSPAPSPHTQCNPSSFGTFGQSPHLLSTAQPNPTQASPSSTTDNITPTKPSEPEMVQASPSDENVYLLQLSAKDFHSREVQKLLKLRDSPAPAMGDGQSKTEQTEGGEVPLGSVEETVKTKITKSRKQLKMPEDEPFVPKDIKKEPDNADDDLVCLDGEEEPVKQQEFLQPPPRMTPEEANGERLTDG